MFNIFGKKSEDISRTTPGFEESERKTPATGKILLIVMFAAGLYFGWQALGDLATIPRQPEPLSSCSYQYRSQYEMGLTIFPQRHYYNSYYLSYSQCTFGQLEKEAGIPELFGKRKPLEAEMESLNSQINSITGTLSNIRNQLKKLTGEYGIGLQEKEVGIEAPLFPVSSQQETITSLRQQEKLLLQQQAELESQKKTLESRLKVIDDQLSAAYKPVFKKQNWLMRWYEFKVFLWQFFFIVPFFLFVFWGYLRLHKKDSPYTVIFTAMLGVTSFLLLKVIFVWFWGLFLADVLRVILEWFKFGIIKSLVFYFGMIFSFLIFGGAVYWLQKKVFDPRRVTIRRFRAKQCPHCQTNLDLAVFYCPNCGSQIKEKCGKCGQARFIGLPYCPYCGSKKQ